MISLSANVTIPKSLKDKLSNNYREKQIESLVTKTGQDALANVKEFGIGVAGGVEPIGGAPHWQGPITVEGHYSGYLSDTHHMVKRNKFHVQIVTDAEFAEGVIEGYSTNWNITFPVNYYHKRAVDKLFNTGLYGNRIQENWSDIVGRKTQW